MRLYGLELVKTVYHSVYYSLKTVSTLVVEIYKFEYLKLSLHPTKFGGHRHCGSGDIMVLTYHVVLQNQKTI